MTVKEPSVPQWRRILPALRGNTTGPGRRRWLVSFLGFFLVFAAWATAAPFDGPADEVQHAIRAVGVTSGQIAPKPVTVLDGQGNPGMGAVQEVPRGLWNHAWCWGFQPDVSAACAPQVSGGPIAPAPTSAGRYHPLYYALVGLPLKLSPSWAGLVLSRLLSAALCAALLASAFTVLSRRSRYGLMLAGLIAAATPMLAHLAGAINPNGLEIAAGIGLFAGGIPLLLGTSRDGRSAGPQTAEVWLVGTSAILLVTLRSLGPVWLAFGLLALLIPVSRTALGRLWAVRPVRRWTVALAVAGALSASWILTMRTGAIVVPAEPLHDFTLPQAAMHYFTSWGNYLNGMVGVAGWFDISMPAPFYWAWVSAAASLLIFGLVVAGWRDRLRCLVIVIGGFVVPGVLQVLQANTVGFIIGGRYMLPLLVGLPLLGAFLVERHLLDARPSRTMTKLMCLLLLPAHVALLVWAMVRWQTGVDGSHFNPFVGEWLPPTGPYLPMLLMIAGIAVVWAATLRVVTGASAAVESGTARRDPAVQPFPPTNDLAGLVAPEEIELDDREVVRH